MKSATQKILDSLAQAAEAFRQCREKLELAFEQYIQDNYLNSLNILESIIRKSNLNDNMTLTDLQQGLEQVFKPPSVVDLERIERINVVAERLSTNLMQHLNEIKQIIRYKRTPSHLLDHNSTTQQARAISFSQNSS